VIPNPTDLNPDLVTLALVPCPIPVRLIQYGGNAVDTTSISKTTWCVVLACHSCVKWTVVPAVIDARSVTVRWHAVVQGTSSVARMDHNRWRISWISPLLPCTYCILRCQSLTVCVCLANVKCLFWGCWVFIEKACKNVHAAELKAVSIVMVQKVNWRIEHAYAKIWAGNQENIQRRQIKIDLNRKRLL